jgi:hypothetical protein
LEKFIDSGENAKEKKQFLKEVFQDRMEKESWKKTRENFHLLKERDVDEIWQQ